MENSNRKNSGKLNQCPYECLLYGADKSDLVYRKSYQGDWGHWDDLSDVDTKHKIETKNKSYIRTNKKVVK